MPLPNPALNVQAEYKQDQFQSFYYRKPRENTNAWGNMIYFLKEQSVKIGFEQFLVLNIRNKFLWYRGWVDLSISWCLKAILLLKGTHGLTLGQFGLQTGGKNHIILNTADTFTYLFFLK